MAGYRSVCVLTAVLALLAACERPSAVASRDDRPAAAETAAPSSERAEARRDESPVKLVDGKPMWSASRRGTAEENAQRSYDRNGEAFGAKDLDDFVKKAHAFVDDPPAGTQRLTAATATSCSTIPRAMSSPWPPGTAPRAPCSSPTRARPTGTNRRPAKSAARPPAATARAAATAEPTSSSGQPEADAGDPSCG